jgi:serine protease Do
MKRRSKTWIVALASFVLGIGLTESAWYSRTPSVVPEAQAASGGHDYGTAGELSDAFARVAERIGPSVVNISSERKVKAPDDADGGNPLRQFFGDDFFQHFSGPHGYGGEGYLQEGLGTGVIVSNAGHIVTNAHVVEGADEVKVKLVDEREFTAKVVGVDTKTDIAVVKIDADGLKPAVLGDSDKLRVGDLVVASGNPFGLSATITTGIVSAKGRANVGIADYEDFIQTDAAINPGNSGGPLVDLEGEVVGINTAIFSRSGGYMGIGFAIPVNMVKTIMTSLIEEGHVTRGWLGIAIQSLDEGLAKSFNYDSTDGVLVGDVTKDSPAGDGGMKTGDIIVAYNGTPVAKADKLRSEVAATAPGSRVTISVFRNGKRKQLKVKVGEQSTKEAESFSGGTAPKLDIGLEVRTLTPELAHELGYDEGTHGVVVTGVDPFGPAAKTGIRPKDVIVQVQDRRIDDVDDFRDELGKHKGEDGVRMVVKRGDAQHFAYLQLKK